MEDRELNKILKAVNTCAKPEPLPEEPRREDFMWGERLCQETDPSRYGRYQWNHYPHYGDEKRSRYDAMPFYPRKHDGRPRTVKEDQLYGPNEHYEKLCRSALGILSPVQGLGDCILLLILLQRKAYLDQLFGQCFQGSRYDGSVDPKLLMEDFWFFMIRELVRSRRMTRREDSDVLLAELLNIFDIRVADGKADLTINEAESIYLNCNFDLGSESYYGFFRAWVGFLPENTERMEQEFMPEWQRTMIYLGHFIDRHLFDNVAENTYCEYAAAMVDLARQHRKSVAGCPAQAAPAAESLIRPVKDAVLPEKTFWEKLRDFDWGCFTMILLAAITVIWEGWFFFIYCSSGFSGFFFIALSLGALFMIWCLIDSGSVPGPEDAVHNYYKRFSLQKTCDGAVMNRMAEAVAEEYRACLGKMRNADMAHLPKALVESFPKGSFGAYIGNTASKKFHRTDCSSLRSSENAVCFDTREEALAAGYTPCGRCKP